MPAQQAQGNQNPEFRPEGPARQMTGVQAEFTQNKQFLGQPNHPTSPSTPGRVPGKESPLYTRGPQDIAPGEVPGGDASATTMDSVNTQAKQSIEGAFLKSPAWLIMKAHEIYTTSTDYLDANITNTWEVSLAHFNNEHAPGSKLRTKNFKRSRVFRPKTRSMIKKSESALAVAMFSSQDYLNLTPVDASDEVQVISAEINKNVLQYRLDSQMPWFQTAIGAYQDTKNYGLCISHNYWSYIADTDYVPEFNGDGSLMTNDTGQAMGRAVPIVRSDTMVCDNVAPENFRFDPMCDWRDPISTSPYLLYMMPVYAGEALERMQNNDPKTGQPTWKVHDLGSLLATRRKNYDRTRQAREGRQRIDPADEQHGNDYTMLWAHMNIVKINGEDYVFWTMGTELLLTDPVPLVKAYPHLKRGERPFTIGFSTVETHRNYPAGDNEQMSGLQEEINTVANQRLDNVKLVLNKRYYVRRGSQVDLDSLVRNVPGGGVMMNDPDKDVKTVDTRDVTGSSYQEQDRLTAEADELTGLFSQGSMQQNGNASNTARGMNAMKQDAGSIGDYGIRIFMETWAEPTLRQFVKMIQYYETDEVILSIAAKQSKLWQRYGIDQVTDTLLQQNLTVRVDIGIGMTDPVKRVERLLYAIEKAMTLPGMADRMKAPALSNEIFATLGYRDGNRFFMTDDEFAKATEDAGDQTPPEIMVKKEELQIRREDNAARHTREQEDMAMTAQLGFAKLAMDKEMTLETLYQKLGMEKEKVKALRDVAALRETNKVHELALKRQTGSGI